MKQTEDNVALLFLTPFCGTCNLAEKMLTVLLNLFAAKMASYATALIPPATCSSVSTMACSFFRYCAQAYKPLKFHHMLQYLRKLAQYCSCFAAAQFPAASAAAATALDPDSPDTCQIRDRPVPATVAI